MTDPLRPPPKPAGAAPRPATSPAPSATGPSTTVPSTTGPSTSPPAAAATTALPAADAPAGVWAGRGRTSGGRPAPPLPPGQRLSPVLSRAAAPPVNDAVIQKTLDLCAAGGVNYRAHLVHEHPFVEGNDVKLLVDGAEAFPALFQDLKNARESIHVSYYIFADDKIGNEMVDLLVAKAKAGVEVNVSLDGVGSLQVLNTPKRNIINRLKEGGVTIEQNHILDVTRSSALLNHPDHRKLVLIDGTVGYTGGMNIADDYRRGFHDVMIRVTGPVVQQMQAEWALSWSYGGGMLVAPRGENPRTPRGRAALRERLFPAASDQAQGAMRARVIQAIPGENKEIFRETLALIAGAKSSIRIENPYCTNPEVRQALIDAARRGVDVELILPGQGDHGFSSLAAKAEYPSLIEAGVKVYEYPGFNHDKVMVVDDAVVSIGSSNLDDVALRHIYELNLLVENEALAQDIKTRLFDVDRARSKRMAIEDVTTLERLTGAFWNLFHDVI